MDGARWRRRTVGLTLCVAAVATLAVALGPRAWWTHRIHHDASIDVGLWSAEVCVGPVARGYLPSGNDPAVAPDRTACTTLTLGEVARRLDANRDHFIIGEVWGDPAGPPPLAFAALGWIVLALGAVAGLLLLALAIAVARGARRPAWPGIASAATITCGGLLAFSLAFVLMAPATIDQMSLALGFTCALAGAGFGLAAASLLGGAEDTSGAPAALERSPQLARATVVTGLGVLVTVVSLHSRTWWVDDNGNLLARHGVRDGETCWDGEPVCEVETWNSQPAGAVGPRPVKSLVAFRASEAAFQLGHLAVMVAILLVVLLLRGQLVTGRWAPHRILAFLVIAYLAAAALLAFGEVPESMDRLSQRSFGPALALLGGGLLIAAGVMTGRLAAPTPLPRARVRQ